MHEPSLLPRLPAAWSFKAEPKGPFQFVQFPPVAPCTFVHSVFVGMRQPVPSSRVHGSLAASQVADRLSFVAFHAVDGVLEVVY